MSMDKKIEKKKFSTISIVTGFAALLIAVVTIYNFTFLDSRSQTTVDKERLFIHEVTEDLFQEYTEVSGAVQPIQTTILDAIEGGVVQQVYLESGEFVEPGDTIVVLSNSNLQLSVMQQEAGLYDQINNVRNSRLNHEQNHLRLQEELASAETQLDLLIPRFERDSLLYQDGLISQQDFEQTRQSYRFQQRRYNLNYESFRKDSLQMENQIAQLDNSEERMWQSLNGVQKILENLVVTAPIGGQLSTIELNRGQSINQGEQLGQIDQLDGYKIRANIDEFYLNRVQNGLQGSFEYAGNRHQVVVTRLFPVINEGRFKVDMEFTGEVPDRLRRGQSVRVRLELGSQSTAKLLTRGPFYEQTGGNWIFLINEEETRAYRQPIRLGRGNTDFFEVLEGLNPGDKVITSGYDTFENYDVLNLK